MSRPRRIYHIATADDAERLRTGGSLHPPSLATEGFVHCSTAEQVVATTERYFEADARLVLLEVDTDLVGADVEIRWPEIYPGQRFPHLHGPIDGAAVVAVHRWGPAERRSWAADRPS